MTVDMNKYQEFTRTTAVYPKKQAINYLALGLNEEAGEVAGKFKKIMRGDTTFDASLPGIIAELGDVLWYVARLADELGLDLAQVAEANVDKLTDRMDRGAIRGNGDAR